MDNAFEANRPRLIKIAERLLDSSPEAEDAVQESFERYLQNQDTQIENIPGWLTTVTARICLDRLRSGKYQNLMKSDNLEDRQLEDEGYFSPEESYIHEESLGIALNEIHKKLPPRERVAYVLHDLFSISHSEISAILECSIESSRQLARRARVKVGTVTSEERPGSSRLLVDAFLSAARQGEFSKLISILHPDCALMPDDIAVVLGTPKGIHGNKGVADFFNGRAAAARAAFIDGAAGAVWAPGGEVKVVFRFGIQDQLIKSIEIIADQSFITQMDIHIL